MTKLKFPTVTFFVAGSTPAGAPPATPTLSNGKLRMVSICSASARLAAVRAEMFEVASTMEKYTRKIAPKRSATIPRLITTSIKLAPSRLLAKFVITLLSFFPVLFPINHVIRYAVSLVAYLLSQSSPHSLRNRIYRRDYRESHKPYDEAHDKKEHRLKKARHAVQFIVHILLVVFGQVGKVIFEVAGVLSHSYHVRQKRRGEMFLCCEVGRKLSSFFYFVVRADDGSPVDEVAERVAGNRQRLDAAPAAFKKQCKNAREVHHVHAYRQLGNDGDGEGETVNGIPERFKHSKHYS